MWQSLVTKLSEDIAKLNLAEQMLSYLPGILMACFYLFVFWGLWKILNKSLQIVFQRAHFDETIGGFMLELLKYFLFIIGLISALAELGINTISLMASLGVLGLTIGFAAKDTLSNLIAGIFIFWDRPFSTGDLVEIDGHYGKVQLITLRSTRIVTPDGKMIAFPNTTIVDSKIVSYTNFPTLRLDIDVTIGVEENIEGARQILVQMIQADPIYLDEPKPRVVVTALNDYNIALQVQAWIADERQHVVQRFALREKVFNTLNQAGVVLPYETLQLMPMDIQLQQQSPS